jgi:hypothetical protein
LLHRGAARSKPEEQRSECSVAHPTGWRRHWTSPTGCPVLRVIAGHRRLPFAIPRTLPMSPQMQPLFQGLQFEISRDPRLAVGRESAPGAALYGAALRSEIPNRTLEARCPNSGRSPTRAG